MKRCLLCKCGIPTEQVYCSNCSWNVWAAMKNAEHGGKYAEEWEQLRAKIQSNKNDLSLSQNIQHS